MNKIIGVFGGDSQVGTSMISQSIAEGLIAEGNKVLYIMASGKLGNQFVTNNYEHSIDDLKPNLMAASLTVEDVNQVIEFHKGMNIIPSVRNSLSAKYFPENTMELIIEPLKSQYDYIIIDGGNQVNLGLVISSLNVSQKRYYVVTQQRKGVERYKAMSREVLEPLNFNGKIIINKFTNSPSLYTKKELEIMIGEKICQCISYIEYGWQCEIENKTLRQFKKFSGEVDEIVFNILGKEVKKRKWIKSFA